MTLDCRESPEINHTSPLTAANDALCYLERQRAAYTSDHERNGNPHTRFLIEFHAEQIEHAIELMKEVYDMTAAEIEWRTPGSRHAT